MVAALCLAHAPILTEDSPRPAGVASKTDDSVPRYRGDRLLRFVPA